jgi:hypothetical protein
MKWFRLAQEMVSTDARNGIDGLEKKLLRRLLVRSAGNVIRAFRAGLPDGLFSNQKAKFG